MGIPPESRPPSGGPQSKDRTPVWAPAHARLQTRPSNLKSSDLSISLTAKNIPKKQEQEGRKGCVEHILSLLGKPEYSFQHITKLLWRWGGMRTRSTSHPISSKELGLFRCQLAYPCSTSLKKGPEESWNTCVTALRAAGNVKWGPWETPLDCQPQSDVTMCQDHFPLSKEAPVNAYGQGKDWTDETDNSHGIEVFTKNRTTKTKKQAHLNQIRKSGDTVIWALKLTESQSGIGP